MMVIIEDKALLSCNIQKDTFTGYGSKLGTYELLYVFTADGYNDLPITINVKVIDTFDCDYYFNNTFYTSKRLTKVELFNSMKAVNLCPNINLNINFNSNYFTIDDDEITNNSVYICNYDYNSSSGYVDSGTFNIIQINQSSSDIVYNNSPGLIVILILIILFISFIGFYFICKHFKIKLFKNKR